jgi:hypothetical protein
MPAEGGVRGGTARVRSPSTLHAQPYYFGRSCRNEFRPVFRHVDLAR